MMQQNLFDVFGIQAIDLQGREIYIEKLAKRLQEKNVNDLLKL